MHAAFKPTDARREVNQMRVISVDVGKKHCQAHITDEEGVILDEFPFDNTFNGIGGSDRKQSKLESSSFYYKSS